MTGTCRAVALQQLTMNWSMVETICRGPGSSLMPDAEEAQAFLEKGKEGLLAKPKCMDYLGPDKKKEVVEKVQFLFTEALKFTTTRVRNEVEYQMALRHLGGVIVDDMEMGKGGANGVKTGDCEPDAPPEKKRKADQAAPSGAGAKVKKKKKKTDPGSSSAEPRSTTWFQI